MGIVCTMRDLILGCSKITSDDDCSHEIKRHLLLGRKAMTNLDSISKSRDITLPTKVHLVKAVVFPVVMNGCESWTIKKAEHRRIDAFKLWCWRRLLRVPWASRRSNQSILKENQSWIFVGRTDAETETPILCHLMWRTDIGKDPDAGIDWGQEEKGTTRGWDGWMSSPTRWTWVSVSSGSWWWTGKPGMLQSMGLQRISHNWATELDWTDCMYTALLSGQEFIPSYCEYWWLITLNWFPFWAFPSTKGRHLPVSWPLPEDRSRLMTGWYGVLSFLCPKAAQLWKALPTPELLQANLSSKDYFLGNLT